MTLTALITEKSVKLFERFHIFTKAELESRVEILYETYAKTIKIEALTMIDMASKQIIPAVISYTKELAETVVLVMKAGLEASVQRDLLEKVNGHLKEMQDALVKLQQAEAKARAMKPGKEQAFFYKDEVKTAMDALRVPADKLEVLVDKKVWPFPTYADLIFEV